MIKSLLKLLRRVIVAIVIIYGIDVLLSGLGFYIPINIPTVLLTAILGLPGFLGLVAMFFLI